MLKIPLPLMLSFVLGSIILLWFPIGSADGDTDGSRAVALNANGIRDDVQAYIDSIYPNPTKKKKAIESYARKIQYAYTKVTTEAEAVRNAEQIMRSLNCIFFLGEGDKAPIMRISTKTINPPDGIEAYMRYTGFLAGNVVTARDPDDTLETVCDFDLKSYPD